MSCAEQRACTSASPSLRPLVRFVHLSVKSFILCQKPWLSQLAEVYSLHLVGQWKDRMVYWAARSMSQQWVMAKWSLDYCAAALRSCELTSLLTVMADGMDQGKFRLPRWETRKTHLVEKFPRPACHVQGVLAHGHALHLAISLPDVPKDTWSNMESLARMLDAIFTQHGTLPHHLHLQQDNCPRDCKNQKVMKTACYLIGKGAFRSVCLSYLRKGHTHEDSNPTPFEQKEESLLLRAVSLHDVWSYNIYREK